MNCMKGRGGGGGGGGGHSSLIIGGASTIIQLDTQLKETRIEQEFRTTIALMTVGEFYERYIY